MRKVILILLTTLCFFSFSCKKQPKVFATPGIYDWSSSSSDGKIITPDSVNQNFKIIVNEDYEVFFYEQDKLLFNGYATNFDQSSTLNNGYRDYNPVYKIKNHTFSRYSFSLDKFSISNFPYASFHFNDRPDNFIPTSFVSNTFVKR